MRWWRIEDDAIEEVGLGDGDFDYALSRKGNLVEVTVLEREADKIVCYAVWNRKEKKFEVGRRNV